MVPLVVLMVSAFTARGIGLLGAGFFGSWSAALAAGLAAMFFLTAFSHWARPRRDGLIAIVPPWIPAPRQIVTVTGILEAAGALGVLVPATRFAAASCLAVLLILMFPANVRAARGVDHPAAPSTPLPLRTMLQVVFVSAAGFVAYTSAGL
ncbi:hypothetical protein GCM10022288_20840 [Gryllotalpicola kribbensis]|jgi:uncharacterized membrane protein|uniref:DoxX family protein n=1 Tax=Gryllotalpicola kribbensis TaxID=993084 RepID=A0ABP8AUJ0_9MICO